MWRAIRYGLSGELIDLERREVLPARARIERLIEWVLPVAAEIGAARVASRPRAERRRASDRALRARATTSREIYGDLTAEPDRAWADDGSRGAVRQAARRVCAA